MYLAVTVGTKNAEHISGPAFLHYFLNLNAVTRWVYDENFNLSVASRRPFCTNGIIPVQMDNKQTPDFNKSGVCISFV
ncbi:hypothetical protein GCM10027185_49720 [Spirosoma pulveris]